MMYKPLTDFRTKVAKANITPHYLSKKAGVDTKAMVEICKIADGKPVTYYHHPYVTERIAWRIAKAFAEITGVRDERGFTELFEEA